MRTSTAFLGHSDVETILREAVEGVGLGIGADTAMAMLLGEAPGQSGLQVVWEEPQRGAHALAALMGTQWAGLGRPP